jgi:hypothetical protein
LALQLPEKLASKRQWEEVCQQWPMIMRHHRDILDPDWVFSRDKASRTYLHRAAFAGHKDVVQLLRQHGGYE